MAVGTDFIASVIQSGDPTHLISQHVPADLFTGSEQELLGYVTAHMAAHKVLPGLDALALASGGEYTELPSVTEVPGYYLEQMRSRYVTRELSKGMVAANAELQKMPPLPQDALSLMVDVTTRLFMSSNASVIVDLTKAKELVLSEVKKALGVGGQFINFGWPYMDQMSSGMRGQDVISILGRPGRGKTWFLLWLALRAWEQGFPVMLVSMEMSKELILLRLASMLAHIDSSLVMSGMLGEWYGKTLTTALDSAAESKNPLYVIEGNRYATVSDIQMLAVQLKPAIILIDGAYMLDHPGIRDRFAKMAETAHQIKHDLAAPFDIPVVASYQFNRDLDKKLAKDKDADADSGDIYGTDAVQQLSSLVLGLMDADTVASLERRKVTVIKGRHGEKGAYYINWMFHNMDFSQWEAPDELTDLDGDM